jgi:hypothetical protein
MPANVDHAKQRNFYDWDVDENNDISSHMGEKGYHPNRATFEVASPEGMLVRITRVPLADGDTQLSVFINSEEMTVDVGGEDGSEPEIQVLLNDATLYDREPGKEPKGTRLTPTQARNVWSFFSEWREHDEDVAVNGMDERNIARFAEELSKVTLSDSDTIVTFQDDEEEDDTEAHKALREALRGEVPDEKLEDAVVLAYDMGCRGASELHDSDMDEIHERFGEA